MPRGSIQPSLRSQWLGEKLRNLRKESGISQAEAANYIQRDQTMLGRYENGSFPFRRVDVLGLLTLYGVDDEKLRDGLLEICDEAWRKDWWDEHRKDLGTEFIDVPWLESRADRIEAYQQLVVHGLLQTREYAGALIRRFEQGHSPADQIERWIEVRMERQQVLRADSAPQFSTIMEESILSRPIGSTETLRGQMKHLLDLVDSPAVTIRIVPASLGAHTGLNGTFVLYRMPDPYPMVAHVETSGGSLYLEEPKVNRFHEVWQDLNQAALDPKQSADLIAKRLKEIR